jgi:hypothetical protein
MKSGRRNENENSQKDLADQFRELQELRIKVSKAERAATQKRPPGVETQIDKSGCGETTNRVRTS